MIVTCPACEGRFEVEKAQLGYDGRIVRCGKCGNCWHQMPEDDPRAALAAAEPDVPPPPRRRPLPEKKKGRGVLVGWVLLLLFVGGVAAGAWFERQRIVDRFPQLADAYALLGIPVTPPDAALDLVIMEPTSDVIDGETVVTVRGTISNVSDHKQTLPNLRAQVLDAAGTVLTEWTFETPRRELDAGGSVSFQTETRNPPAGAQNLNITFVKTGDREAN
jgi:predicted Zn finger-like uncharacterized protein